MCTTINLNLADLLEEKYPHGFHVPADIDLSTFLEYGDEDWTHDLDLEDLLAKKHLIGICWNVKLVLDERPDLTEEQAWKVLQACQPPLEEVTDHVRRTVRLMAREFFPEPKGKDGLKACLAAIGRQVDALPEDEVTDPAAFGRIAATLDAMQTLMKGE